MYLFKRAKQSWDAGDDGIDWVGIHFPGIFGLDPANSAAATTSDDGAAVEAMAGEAADAAAAMGEAGGEGEGAAGGVSAWGVWMVALVKGFFLTAAKIFFNHLIELVVRY